MKLLAVEIVGFGKWQQKRIDFRSENQLFYGENEAGKSTLYQFIQAMLFGFPAKGKRKKDYAPRDGSTYGGRLWFLHPIHGEVQVDRFKSKNKGQATVYFDQIEGDEETLQKLLYPLTKELFQSVFTIQQEQLVQLDKLTEDELHTALLSLGVSGNQQLLISRDSYFKSAQTVYKGKGSQPPLNKKLSEYQQLQQLINEKEQQEKQFQQVLMAISDVKKEKQEKQKFLIKAKAQLEAVNTQIMHLPLLEELQSLDLQQEEVQLTPEEQNELSVAYQQYQFLNEELVRLNQQLDPEADVAIDETKEYQFYLANETIIKKILEQRYVVDKLVSETKWLTESLIQNEQEQKQLEIRWSWSSEQPPRFTLDEAEVNALRTKWQEQMLEREKIATTQQLLEEELVARERDLSIFEQQNPRLFEKRAQTKTKQTNVVIFAIAFVIAASSFFLSVPFRYFTLTIGTLIGVIGFLPMFSQRNKSSESQKKQWQEKLSKLDYLNDQLINSKHELQRAKNEHDATSEWIKKVVSEHHLGTMDQLDDWIHHRNEISRYALLLKDHSIMNKQLANKQNQLAEIARLTEPLSEILPIATSSLSQRLRLISDFSDRMEKIRFSQEHQVDAYTQQSIRELKEKKQRIIDEINPLLYRSTIESMNQIPSKLAQYQKNQTKQQRKDELQQILKNVYQEVIDPTEIHERQVELSNRLKLMETEFVQYQQQEQEYLFRKQQMLVDGTLDELYQQQALLKTQLDDLALEWTSDVLAGQLLMDLLTELSEQQLPSLIKKAGEYVQLITENTYQALELSAEQLELVRSDKQRFFLHELSTGTRDQVIMAVRFAFLSTQAQRQLCPIIIDDGWLHYDHQRKKYLARLLCQLSKKEQVICFSSDTEMVSYYKELDQPIIEL